MTEPYPILSKAPIKEALIDIQVSFANNLELENLNVIYDDVKELFPIKENKFEWKTDIQLKDTIPEISDHHGGQVGYQFKSSDKTKILQVTKDRFTFNKLYPYDNWANFSKEAKELWNIYNQKLSPSSIKRLGLRYINRIEIPLPIKDIRDYILTSPIIAPNIPNSISNLYMRLEIQNTDIESIAVITESIDKISASSINEPKLPLIFDIDVIKIVRENPDDSKIWDYFDVLRSFKNQIFFNSITDKTKDLLR